MNGRLVKKKTLVIIFESEVLLNKICQSWSIIEYYRKIMLFKPHSTISYPSKLANVYPGWLTALGVCVASTEPICERMRMAYLDRPLEKLREIRTFHSYFREPAFESLFTVGHSSSRLTQFITSLRRLSHKRLDRNFQ